MSIPGRPGRNGNDQMAQLDAAMNETFAELAQQGTGVAPADVVPSQERRRPRRERDEPADDTSWLSREQQPRRRQRRTEQAQDDEPDAGLAVLDEAQDSAAADGRPQRDSQGRFLPQRAATDEDEDDDSDEDEDDRSTSGGRRVTADADEAEGDDFESEGRQGTESDEEGRQRRGRRRFPREVRREIDRQVRAQVGKVVEERDRLREAESQRTAVEGQALDFLVKAIGTQQQREALQAKALNTRLPVDQRNQAAALLKRYTDNEKYVRTYRTALLATIRHEQAQEDTKVMQELAKYQIQLDPAIVGEGRRDKTLIHAVRQGILLERKRNEAELAKQRRASQTRRGYDSEREVRSNGFARPTMASSNGRRANGRVATVDRLRGAMGMERGLGNASRIAAPTDETLRQLRDGEITLRDLGLVP